MFGEAERGRTGLDVVLGEGMSGKWPVGVSVCSALVHSLQPHDLPSPRGMARSGAYSTYKCRAKKGRFTRLEQRCQGCRTCGHGTG